MKKTFPVNINGAIFYIDEDAYALLNNYLSQLRQAFPGDEGKEIVTDIEARIAELFSEIINGGANVITLDDVNAVIEKMGRPADLSDSPDSVDPKNNEPTTPPPFQGVAKKLYRNMQNKVFGGVLGGLGCYLGWNTNILRLLVIVLTLCTYVWPLIIIYLVAWMVIPAALTPRQILEMRGTPVTVGNVGTTILGTSDPSVPEQSSGILGALGKIILIFFGIIAGLIGLGTLVVFIKILCGIIVYWGWGSADLLDDFNFTMDHTSLTAGAIGSICLAFAIAIPCIALVWATCAVVFKIKGISKPIIISGLILEVLLIICATILIEVANIPPMVEFSISAAALTTAPACIA